VDDYIDGDKDYCCTVTKKMKLMLKGSIIRAKDKHWEHDLTLEHLLSLYLEICPILGIEIKWDNSITHCHGSPSLDRINNKKGYIQGNVQIISHRANSLKKDYLLVEWAKMQKYMEMCDGKPIVITDEYFNEPCQLSEWQKRHIRGALKRNESVIQISRDLEISVSCILKVKRTL